MKTKKVLILSIVFLIVSLVLPLASNAVTVSPPIIELDAAKGDVITQSVKVRNEGTSAATFYLSTEKFIAAGETGSPQFVSGGEDVDLVSWIKFPYDNISVPGGATVEIPFTIVVPSYASPGGHYAAIFIGNVPPKAVGETSQVSIASRIGTLVLVRIAGEVKESAEVLEFSTSAKTYGSLPVDFAIRVKNSGNVHIKPSGSILVKNMLGSVVGKVDANDKGGNVLPDSIRKFDAQWIKNPNAVGAQTFWGKYREQKENYAFGKYTADLNLAYGTAGKTLMSSVSFWVIPWNIILVNLLIVVIIVVIAYYGVKKYNDWILKKYAKKAKK